MKLVLLSVTPSELLTKLFYCSELQQFYLATQGKDMITTSSLGTIAGCCERQSRERPLGRR